MYVIYYVSTLTNGMCFAIYKYWNLTNYKLLNTSLTRLVKLDIVKIKKTTTVSKHYYWLFKE